VPEARVRLRDDNRIRHIESAAKHDEPKRAESFQVLKASGTMSGQCSFAHGVCLEGHD
jgi:hypothetical protein